MQTRSVPVWHRNLHQPCLHLWWRQRLPGQLWWGQLRYKNTETQHLNFSSTDFTSHIFIVVFFFYQISMCAYQVSSNAPTPVAASLASSVATDRTTAEREKTRKTAVSLVFTLVLHVWQLIRTLAQRRMSLNLKYKYILSPPDEPHCLRVAFLNLLPHTPAF